MDLDDPFGGLGPADDSFAGSQLWPPKPQKPPGERSACEPPWLAGWPGRLAGWPAWPGLPPCPPSPPDATTGATGKLGIGSQT